MCHVYEKWFAIPSINHIVVSSDLSVYSSDNEKMGKTSMFQVEYRMLNSADIIIQLSEGTLYCWTISSDKLEKFSLTGYSVDVLHYFDKW